MTFLRLCVFVLLFLPVIRYMLQNSLDIVCFHYSKPMLLHPFATQNNTDMFCIVLIRWLHTSGEKVACDWEGKSQTRARDIRVFKKQSRGNVMRRMRRGDEGAHWRSLISAAQTADEAELSISHYLSSDDFSILQIWLPECDLMKM